MVYRNIKTGAEIITNSVIMAPNWKPMTEEVAPKEAPKPEPPKAELPKEEPPKVETRSAPKKATYKKKGSRK